MTISRFNGLMDNIRFIKDKNFDELPKTAGVYFLGTPKSKDGGGFAVLYIGKAINIKDRVKNHFQQPSYRDNLYISKVNKIGYLETSSEIEALVLEANLIKKHQPKFNVIWRDDKNYFYVAVENNKEKIPFIYITHQKKLGPVYIGPFVEGTALKKTLRFLRKVFPYYTSAKHSKLKCTYCHLDLCPGPLSGPDGTLSVPALLEYRKNIKKLILVLSGKKSSVLSSLKKEMTQLAKFKKFEEAGKIRDQIYNLQQVMAHSHVVEARNPNIEIRNAGEALAKIIGLNRSINRIECYDISNIQGKFATGSMVVFSGGQPNKNQYKKFKIKLGDTPNDIAMLKEVFKRRLSHKEWTYPEVMLIDGGKAQLNAAIEIKGNSPIKIISIAKGRQELFIEGRESAIPLKELPQEVRNLILQLDAEAHRFAITYHKKLRRENILK